jgi:hypothetical protein
MVDLVSLHLLLKGGHFSLVNSFINKFDIYFAYVEGLYFGFHLVAIFFIPTNKVEAVVVLLLGLRDFYLEIYVNLDSRFNIFLKEIVMFFYWSFFI